MYSLMHNSCHASFGVRGVAQLQGRISKLEESWQFVGLYDRRIEVRFPDKTSDFSLLQSIQNGYMAHPSYPSTWTVGKLVGTWRQPKLRTHSYTSPPADAFMVWCLIKHRDFTCDCDELHALRVMTQRPPGNHYTKQNNQRCKYVAVAKAGGRPWALSFRNTGPLFVKTLPLRIHGERCSRIPAGWMWMGNCAARRMRWEFSWRSGDAHKKNRFTLGVTVTPTTPFITIITAFAFFYLFVYVFLEFFVHLHFVVLLSISSPAVSKKGLSFHDTQHTDGE